MKLFLIICVTLYSSLLYSQKQSVLLASSAVALVEVEAPLNTTCAQAKLLCPDTKQDDSYSIVDCGGVVKLYYYFTTSSNYTGLLASVTTDSSATVNLYGSYNSLSELCGSIPGTPLVVSTGTSHSLTASSIGGEFMLIEVVLSKCTGNVLVIGEANSLNCELTPCSECLPPAQFPPAAYVLSAWVKEGSAPLTTTSYENAKISVTHSGSTVNTFSPQGQIIDGWQRIEGTFNIVTPGNLSVKLLNTTGSSECFFDDIRILPFDGSMMSYVYDPVTLRLVAELDERNYAKIYEYDEEGKLVRVKKETESGIMTIQESRNNSSGNE